MLHMGCLRHVILNLTSIINISWRHSKKGQQFVFPRMRNWPHCSDIWSLPILHTKLSRFTSHSMFNKYIVRCNRSRFEAWHGPSFDKRRWPCRQTRDDSFFTNKVLNLPSTKEKKAICIFFLKRSNCSSPNTCNAKSHQTTISNFRCQMLQNLHPIEKQTCKLPFG